MIGIGLAAVLLLAGCREEAPAVPEEAIDAPAVPEEVADETAADVPANAAILYAGADMDGTSVTLAMGETLRIELESIPTAGYIWQITARPDILELAGEGGRPTDPDVQNQPGYTGGNHYLSFDLTAVAAGTGTLELVEGRPWELKAGEAPDDTYSLQVTVTE
ncbi:MAG: protease inhibitor I42 family protein [Hyphomonas sp.]|nr:protease inhibitor I42 family protein [Hyphomonas sp.]